MREVYCHYKKDWIALGRSRKKCPHCGATLNNAHPVRGGEAQDAGQQVKDVNREQAL